MGAAFAPRDSEPRVCQDKEGWRQKLLVTAVLVQEDRYWSEDHKKEFGRVLVGDEYNIFWDMYDVKADCVDLLERANDIKSNIKKKGKVRSGVASEGGVQKKTAALVRGLERMGVAEDIEL